MDIKEVSLKMLESLTHKGLDSVLQAAYEILELPIAAADISFTMLAPNYPPVDQGFDIWDLPQKERHVPLGIIETFYKDNILPQVLKNPSKTFYLDWGSMSDTPCLTTAIRSNGVIEGYIAVFCPKDKLQNWHFDALPVISDAIGVALVKENKIKRSRNTLMETFMQSLLSGDIATADDLDRWEEILSLTFSKSYIVLSLRAGNNSPVDLKDYLQEYFFGRFHFAYLATYGQSLVIILQNMSGQSNLSAILDEILSIAGPLDVKCGISNLFGDILQASSYYQQADLSVSMGMKLHPGERCYYFSDYLLYAMLDNIYAAPHVDILIHPALPLLRQYDERHNADFYPTLKAYINNWCNMTNASKELHIHRNTLQYRIERIQEHASIDLADQKTILELAMGLILYDYICK